MSILEWLIFNLAEPLTQVLLVTLFLALVGWPASVLFNAALELVR